MTNLGKSLFKTIGTKAKETALEGKQRLEKWAENEKIRKFKENNQRKDLIGNEILFIKQQITEAEEKLHHLRNTTVRLVMVNIEGMDIPISVEKISEQYEDKLAILTKRKEKIGKEFLALEEKITADKDIAEKIDLIEKRKQMRYRSIKSNVKESAFAELLPLMAEMPNYLTNGDDLNIEDTFGLLELRYKEDRLECFHNGLIINIKLDMFGTIEQVGIVDWRNDEPIYLADGSATHLAELDWRDGVPSHYENEFFEMIRALKYVYMHHFEPLHEV